MKRKVKKVKKGTGTTPKELKKLAAPKLKKSRKGIVIEPKVETVTEDRVFTEWKNGTSIAELVVAHKLTRSQCRRRLTEAAGGKAKFRELRDQGAGGQATSGRRTSGGRRETDPGLPTAAPRVDDSKAKKIKSSKGWEAHNIYKNVLVKIKDLGMVPWREQLLTIYTSPKTGRRYVTARPDEPADVIHIGLGLGLGVARLKRLERSRDAAKVMAEIEQDEQLKARGLEKHKQVRAEKRQARKARKAKQGTAKIKKGGRS